MEILTVLSTLGIGGIILTIVNHFLSKRKYNSEVKAADIINLEKTLDFYKKVTEDLSLKLSTYIRQTEKLMAELAIVNESVNELYKLTCTKSECRERVMLDSSMYKNLISKIKFDQNDNRCEIPTNNS